MNTDHTTHDIHINTTYNTLRVDHVGYEQIKKLAWDHAVCETCYRPFSTDNPMVSRTECLKCFTKREKLIFLGLIPFDDSEYGGAQGLYNPYSVKLYQHMNQDGWIYETKAGPGQSYDATRESTRTLRYWGFLVPERAILPSGQAVSCENFSWSIDGDLKTDPILALEHRSRIYSNEVIFFAQRGGPLVQLNRRKPLHRQLLEAAKRELEKYKDAHGEYDLWGEHKKWLLEEDLYRMAAHLSLPFHLFPANTGIIQPLATSQHNSVVSFCAKATLL